MSVGSRVFKSIFDQRGIEDNRYASAGFQWQAAARMMPLSLFEQHHKQIRLPGRVQRGDQATEQFRQPGVGNIEGAVVRVVAQVRGDENEIRKRSRFDVRLKHSKGHNALFAARGIQPDRVEVNERIMLLNVVAFASEKAWFRDILLIRFPGAASGFDQVREAGRIDEAIAAIALDPKCVTAHQCNIVRQAGMPDCVILREQGVFTRQPVVIRHERIANHGSKLLVLEHDDDDMVEVWNRRFWRGS